MMNKCPSSSYLLLFIGIYILCGVSGSPSSSSIESSEDPWLLQDIKEYVKELEKQVIPYGSEGEAGHNEKNDSSLVFVPLSKVQGVVGDEDDEDEEEDQDHQGVHQGDGFDEENEKLSPREDHIGIELDDEEDLGYEEEEEDEEEDDALLPRDLTDLDEDSIADEVVTGVDEFLEMVNGGRGMYKGKNNYSRGNNDTDPETRQMPMYLFGQYSAEPRLNRFIDGALKNMGNELRGSAMDPIYFRVLPKGIIAESDIISDGGIGGGKKGPKRRRRKRKKVRKRKPPRRGKRDVSDKKNATDVDDDDYPEDYDEDIEEEIIDEIDDGEVGDDESQNEITDESELGRSGLSDNTQISLNGTDAEETGRGMNRRRAAANRRRRRRQNMRRKKAKAARRRRQRNRKRRNRIKRIGNRVRRRFGRGGRRRRKGNRRRGGQRRRKKKNRMKPLKRVRRGSRGAGGGKVEGLSRVVRDGDAEMQLFGNYTLIRSHMKIGPVDLVMQFRTKRGIRRAAASMPLLRAHTVTRVNHEGSEMVDFLLDRPHPETIQLSGNLAPVARKIARNVFARLFLPESFLMHKLREKSGLAFLSRPTLASDRNNKRR